MISQERGNLNEKLPKIIALSPKNTTKSLGMDKFPSNFKKEAYDHITTNGFNSLRKNLNEEAKNNNLTTILIKL